MQYATLKNICLIVTSFLDSILICRMCYICKIMYELTTELGIFFIIFFYKENFFLLLSPPPHCEVTIEST